jgi:hypothetical protein
MTTHHAINDKLFAVQADHNADQTVIVCGDTRGPVVALMDTPDDTGFMTADEARAIAGEIERRWNIHQPLAEALHELRTFVGKLTTSAGQQEAERADAVLTRLRFEVGGEKVLVTTRERFEAWFRSLPENSFVQEIILIKRPDGKYESLYEQKIWNAYRAADSGLPTPLERRLTSLIGQFFDAWPNIEEADDISGADMISFVTDWMSVARKELGQMEPA